MSGPAAATRRAATETATAITPRSLASQGDPTPAATPAAKVTVGKVAVMSIHPQYAEQILAGTKRVEFRKRPIADDVTHVIVYATAPVRAVVGAFTVDGQHTLNPQTLWHRFHRVGGIAWADFIDYYDGRATGTGIAVGEVFHATEQMNLHDDFGIAHPPQSYQYLCTDAARSAILAMSPS